MNCACGNFSPSMPIKGIVPPSPIHTAPFPKWVLDAASHAASSQPASGGAFQPAAPFSATKRTSAPDGGSRSSVDFRALVATAASTIGGIRRDNLMVVIGRSTLPASCKGGRPSIPITDNAGRQLRLSTASVPVAAGRISPRQGNLSCTASPNTWATTSACLRRCDGISTCNASTKTDPVVESSMRSSNCRRIRKDDGTMPEASPE